MATGKRERSSQKKKDRIIETTTRLLLKKGSLTSTTDVCHAAKLTRPTLYHYFGSKRNLLLSVHRATIERDLKPYMAEARKIGDPLERLKYMVRTHTKTMCSHPELRVLIHDTLIVKDKYFREVREEWKEHYVLLRDTIAALKANDTIQTDVKPSWAALFVLGMITWVTYWFDYERGETVDEIANAAVQLVLNSLRQKKAIPEK